MSIWGMFCVVYTRLTLTTGNISVQTISVQTRALESSASRYRSLDCTILAPISYVLYYNDVMMPDELSQKYAEEMQKRRASIPWGKFLNPDRLERVQAIMNDSTPLEQGTRRAQLHTMWKGI